MAIIAVCRACGTEHRVADTSAGKTFRCKGCSQPVSAPRASSTAIRTAPSKSPVRGASVPTPKPRRTREEYEEDDDEAPKGRFSTGLIVGLSVGGGVALVLVVVLVVVLLNRSTPDEVAANNGPAPQPNFPAFDPARPVVKPQPKPVVPPVAPVEPPQPPPPPPPPKKTWDYQLDPIAKPVKAARAKTLIPFPPNSYIESVGGVSPCVMVCKYEGGRKFCQVWNLETLKQEGTFAYPLGNFPTFSPDGKFLAGLATVGVQAIQCIDTQSGQNVATVPFRMPTIVRAVSFSDPEHITVAGEGGVSHINWKTRQIAKTFPIPNLPTDPNGRWPLAFSLGGKYLAMFDNAHAVLFHVATGEQTGKIQVPLDADKVAFQFDAMAFSHDGRELAVLFQSSGKYRVAVLDLEKGVYKEHVELFGGQADGLTLVRHFEWMPDGNAWYLAGRYFAERRGGRLLFKLPQGADLMKAPRLVDNDYMAVAGVVPGGGLNTFLSLAPLPRAEMDRIIRDAQEMK